MGFFKCDYVESDWRRKENGERNTVWAIKDQVVYIRLIGLIKKEIVSKKKSNISIYWKSNNDIIKNCK